MPISLLALLCAACTYAQRFEGTYHPTPPFGAETAAGTTTGTGEEWSINQSGCLMWSGQPYMPIGTIVDSPAAIERAAALGIKDFEVDLPASGTGWSEEFAELSKVQARYVIRINSLAPMARGVAVEPQGYRFSGIKTKRTIRASLPGCSSALVVVAIKRDGTVTKYTRVNFENGQLSYDVDASGGAEEVVLIYPITTSAEQIDFWEAMDQHRDQLFESLHKHAPPDGLRGIVNPLGRTISLTGPELRFVPTSPYFRIELRNLLLDRYKNLETAQRLWSMGASGISDFDAMSRLIPLWSGTRGVSQLWDPETDHLYACDNRRSAAWADIRDVISLAASRRYGRITNGLHAVVDVPIVQEWAGWAAAYESKDSSLDGIGMRSTGTAPSVVLDTAARAKSSLLRWARTGWLPATDVDLGPGSDPAELPSVLDTVTGVGARGEFVRADTPEMLKAVATAAQHGTDPILAQTTISAVFYPENALNPAETQRLPGGKWWLPSPMDGDRLDLGTSFFCYRYKDHDKTTFALWTRTPARVKLDILKPQTLTFTALDGSDPGPKPYKGGVEVLLTAAPLIITGTDDIPVPVPAYAETLNRFTQLAMLMQQAHVEATDELYDFQEAYAAYGRNPGAAFLSMRDAFRKLSARLGHFTWIEAEHAEDTNFSEALASPSCSGGQCLALRTELPPDEGGYFAEYPIQVRSTKDQEVWIAARIPPDRRADVQIQIGGQILTLDTEPKSLYGNGFGWYKAGVTRFAGVSSAIRVVVTGDTASDLAIDAICLSPSPFTPDGVWQPDPIPFTQSTEPKGKGGRRGGSRSANGR